MLFLGLLCAFVALSVFLIIVFEVWDSSIKKMKSSFLAQMKNDITLLLEKTPEQVWMYHFTSSMVFSIILFILGTGGIGGRLITAAVGAVAGIVACKMLLKILVTRKLKSFNEQIPQLLSSLTAILKAGQNLDQAFIAAEQEMPKPMLNAVRYINQFRKMGGGLEQALEDIAVIVARDPDFRIFATAVIFQRQSGGNLIEVFGRILHTIAEKKRVEHKLAALTAQGKMQGLVLCLLPIGLMALLWVMDPSYIGILFTNGWGNIMLIIALLLEIIGAIVIKKVITIEI